MKEARPITQANTADPNAHEHTAAEIPACPVGFPAPQERGGMRLRSPAARGPGGETPAAKSGPG